jgi:hypothetical protein
MAAMRTLVVDYNRIGCAETFRLVLLGDERAGIPVGSRVLIVGDDVPPREAVVTGWTEGTGEAEFSFRV